MVQGLGFKVRGSWGFGLAMIRLGFGDVWGLTV